MGTVIVVVLIVSMVVLGLLLARWLENDEKAWRQALRDATRRAEERERKERERIEEWARSEQERIKNILSLQLIATALVLASCGSVTPFDDDTDIETDTAGDTAEETNDTIHDTIPDESETIPDVSETEAPETTEDTTEDTVGDESEAPCVVCYRDFDMDGYGRDDDTVCQEACTGSYVPVGGDCCDGDGEVHPGQEAWFLEPYTCPGESWDYNCNGAEDYRYPVTPPPAPTCYDYAGTSEEECESHAFWTDGTAGVCGEMESGVVCTWWAGTCSAMGAIWQECH